MGKHKKARVVYAVRRCLVCDKEFIPKKSWQTYCSPVCQMKNYNIIHDIPGRLREEHKLKKKG